MLLIHGIRHISLVFQIWQRLLTVHVLTIATMFLCKLTYYGVVDGSHAWLRVI